MTDATVLTSRDRFHAVAPDAPTDARVAVQFHPESVLTEIGKEMVRNSLGICRRVNQ